MSMLSSRASNWSSSSGKSRTCSDSTNPLIPLNVMLNGKLVSKLVKGYEVYASVHVPQLTLSSTLCSTMLISVCGVLVFDSAMNDSDRMYSLDTIPLIKSGAPVSPLLTFESIVMVADVLASRTICEASKNEEKESLCISSR